MKKIFKSAIFIAASSAIAFTSCKKTDEATPLKNAESTATIKGQLLCDKDETNDADGAEFVDTDPAIGAKIKVTTYSDITGDKGNPIVQIITVDANGNYLINVPSTAEGAYVEIEAYDYETKLKFNYFDKGTKKEGTENGYFSGFYIDDITVYPNEVKNLDKEYYGAFNSTANPSKY